MATSKKALVEQRFKLINQQKDLHKRASDEDRELKTDEREQWDKIESDLVGIRQRISDADALARNIADAGDYGEQRSTVIGGKPGGEPAPKEDLAKRHASAFEKIMRRGGLSGLSAEERKVIAEKRGTDPQSTSPDGSGGFLVPESWSTGLIETMKAYGTLLGVATIDRPSQGGTHRYPTHNGTAETGRWVAENDQRVTSDTSFGETSLGDHEVTSDIIRISAALAQDNSYNLEGRLSGWLGRRIGVTMGEAMTNGDGTGKPRGVILDASAGVTSAAADAITFDDLINLEHSLDPAYRVAGNGRFMFSDQTLAAIKKLSFGSNDARPLWIPSVREGEPDRILGYSYLINQAMPELGATNVPVLFGDFSKYQVKMARDITMFVFRELYMERMQLGYMANARVDGRLLDTSAVKKLTNAAA